MPGKGHIKTLVLGLGNPILGDDGVGCRVAMALKDRLERPGVDVVEAGVAGLDLLEIFAGYDRAIIVDAIQTGQGTPGQIYRFGPGALASTRHAGTPHDVNLATALELGRRLALPLPSQIIILAIEVKDVTSFGEDCTAAVASAIPKCVRMIIDELKS
jgi:hydrogenase maturation protease